MNSNVDKHIEVNYLDDQAPTKDKFWEQLEAILTMLYQIHPIEMIETEQGAAHMRSIRTKAVSGGVFPIRLAKWVDLIYREEGSLPFKNKAEMYRGFYKKYPQFSYSS